MNRMRGVTQKIELRRALLIGTGKCNLLVSPAHVKRIELLQFIGHAVYSHCPGRADIEYAKLSSLGKIRGSERVRRRQRQGLANRHSGADYGAIQIDIRQANLPRLK